MLHHGLQTGAPMESALLVDHYLGPFQVMAFANNPEELNAEAQRRFALTSAIDHAQRVTLPVWRRLGMV
jgi:hypothetical protein